MLMAMPGVASACHRLRHVGMPSQQRLCEMARQPDLPEEGRVRGGGPEVQVGARQDDHAGCMAIVR